MPVSYFEPLKLRSDVAAQKLLVSYVNLRLAWIKANFHPDQPRVPSGNPDGGQWTDTGASGGSDSNRTTSYHLVAERVRQYSVDLNAEEQKYRGHTLKHHVAKTDTELLDRMGPPAPWYALNFYNLQKNGTFFSYEEASEYINEILNENKDIVDQVAEGTLDDKFILKYYSHITGREFVRADPYSIPTPRETYAVGVLIRHAKNVPKKYFLVTAYPTNGELIMETKYFEVPDVFNRFAFYIDQESWACRTTDELAKHGLRGVKSTDIIEFVNFVHFLQTLSPEELNLEEFWNKSPSALFFVGHNYVSSFLKRAADIAVTEGTDFIEIGDSENFRYVKR